MPDIKAPAAPAAPVTTPAAASVASPVATAPIKVEAKETPAAKKTAVDNPSENASPPAEKSAEKRSETPTEAVEPDPQEPIGPRWFAVRTQSQLGAVNVLIKDTVRDAEVNVSKAIERFKLGHGITSTPHEITAQDLGPDWVPTAADLDYHNAIEAANG